MLLRLKTVHYQLIVVTNQPDVGNGIIPQSTVEAMHDKICKELPIDHIEVCHHTRQDKCDCRKPKPGMLLKAIKKFNINIEHSFMIGDRCSDIEAGRKLNLKTIFIDYHYQEPMEAIPDYICESLSQSAEIILNPQ